MTAIPSTQIKSRVGLHSTTKLRVLHYQAPFERWNTFGAIWRNAFPTWGLGWEVNRYRIRNLWNVLSGFWPILFARIFGIPTYFGALYLEVRRANGEVLNLGLVGLKMVTTVGVNFLVDAWQASATLANLKYHGIGTGGAAEAVGNTALTTEITTQYASDNVRPTGSLAEGASANIFRSVGTITVDGAVAATEHGLFDQAAVGGGVLWDRTLFSVVNLASGDSLQVTYECTFPAGS
jgi:hypothetical protein